MTSSIVSILHRVQTLNGRRENIIKSWQRQTEKRKNGNYESTKFYCSHGGRANKQMFELWEYKSTNFPLILREIDLSPISVDQNELLAVLHQTDSKFFARTYRLGNLVLQSTHVHSGVLNFHMGGLVQGNATYGV